MRTCVQSTYPTTLGILLAGVTSPSADQLAASAATPQGFMQDKIIASHTCFGGHTDVNY